MIRKSNHVRAVGRRAIAFVGRLTIGSPRERSRHARGSLGWACLGSAERMCGLALNLVVALVLRERREQTPCRYRGAEMMWCPSVIRNGGGIAFSGRLGAGGKSRAVVAVVSATRGAVRTRASFLLKGARRLRARVPDPLSSRSESPWSGLSGGPC